MEKKLNPLILNLKSLIEVYRMFASPHKMFGWDPPDYTRKHDMQVQANTSAAQTAKARQTHAKIAKVQ